MKFIIRLVINAIALWAAAQLIGGIQLTEAMGGILFVALIFGVVNAVVKPIITILSLPAVILTLGLFLLVINTLLLSLTAALSSNLAVDGFGSAFLGSIVISIVSWLLSMFLDDDNAKRDARR